MLVQFPTPRVLFGFASPGHATWSQARFRKNASEAIFWEISVAPGGFYLDKMLQQKHLAGGAVT